MSTSVTTTTSLITPDISTLGKSSNLDNSGGGDGHCRSSVSDTADSASCAAATSLLLAASTEQLNQVIRKINPFEANFRQANKVKREHDLYSDHLSQFCVETSPSSLGSVATTDGNKSAGSTSADEPSSASMPSMPSFLTGSSSQQKGLLLKLPDMLGSGSSGLPSASVETPDLSSLINQVIKNGSPLIAVPQTADVLKTALELRENLDVGRQRGAASDLLRLNFGQAAGQSPGVLFKFHPFFGGSSGEKSATLNFSLTELQSPSKDFLNMNSTELMHHNSLRITPPNWSMEQQKTHLQHHNIHHSEASIARHSPNKIRRFEDNRLNPQTVPPSSIAQLPPAPQSSVNPSSSSSSSLMYVPVKLGEQMVYVPMLGADEANHHRDDHNKSVVVVEEHHQQQTPSATPAPARSLAKQALTPGRQSATPSRMGQDYHQQFMEELHRKDSCSSIASPGLGPPEEERRKESLERNKEAAWRYRKRKKEERWLLEEKAKALESEKIELMTQVSLLKNELARVNQLLNEHKNCPLMNSSTCLDYGSPPQTGKQSTPRRQSMVASSSSSTPGPLIIHGSTSQDIEDVKPVILAPSSTTGHPCSSNMPQHFGLVPSPFGAIVSHSTAIGPQVSASVEANIFENSHFDAR